MASHSNGLKYYKSKHDESLMNMFVKLVSEGTAVPGLMASENKATEVMEAKRRWLEPLGAATIAESYRQFPVLKNYLEYHENTKGQPMELEGRPYLLDILTDEARKIVIQKCVQCGVTEIALVKAYTAAQKGLSILYTLPGHPERNRFVSERVDSHLARIPYYRAMLKSAKETYANKASDAKGLKHFGKGLLHFVGSNTSGEFSSFPADFLIVDEKDLCNPTNLGLAKDRLTESDYKWELHISNPRAAGSPHRLGLMYQQSDAKVWEVACEHCGHFQEMKWTSHFVEQLNGSGWQLKNENAKPECVKCGEEFNRLGAGRWKPTNPGARSSGYKISKLFTKSAEIPELFETFKASAFNDTLLQIFYASELGEYYQPKASHISLEMLTACINPKRTEWANPQEGPVVMGIDVGAVLNVKASVYSNGRRMACAIEALSNWGDLMALVKRLRPVCIVIDAEPEHHKVEEFATECPYPVWACRYGSPNALQEIKFDPNDYRRPMEVTANRTATMDAAYAEIAQGLKRVELPPQAQFVEQFFYQMCTAVRIWDPDGNKGAGRYVWTETGEDHYRHADVYERIAAQILERTGIQVTRLR